MLKGNHGVRHNSQRHWVVVWSETSTVLVSIKREERALRRVPLNCLWASLKDRIKKFGPWEKIRNDPRKSWNKRCLDKSVIGCC